MSARTLRMSAFSTLTSAETLNYEPERDVEIEKHQFGEEEKGQEGTPSQQEGSVDFWSQELKRCLTLLSALRRGIFERGFASKLTLRALAIALSAFILAVLSLYWAALFHVESNLYALVVYFVDFDGQVEPYTGVAATVGPMVVQTAESFIAPSGSVSWGSLPTSSFNFDPMAVRQAI
ncbi:hypothetical protein BDZ45DRAFT_739918 [Acephala macrosclerotiorum]|nr:hypothetical protein BDZ45DRAFT_739918 [Acephala macrosclerotiorum]